MVGWQMKISKRRDCFRIQQIASILIGAYIQIINMEELPRKKLNIVVISDTHRSYRQLDKVAEMSGDIFIHAGDFTRYGCDKDFLKFFQYLDRLKFRHKVVIAGNHEIVLDNGCIKPAKRVKYLEKYPCKLTREQVIAELKKRCIYLEHEFVEIEGVRIFGSPYSPYYVGNAFQYNQKDEKIIWDCIPEKVDLLVTHCPPLGILDKTTGGKHGGSAYLREVVAKRRPKYHVFGHIHEAAGMFKADGVTFLNVANDPTRIIL